MMTPDSHIVQAGGKVYIFGWLTVSSALEIDLNFQVGLIGLDVRPFLMWHLPRFFCLSVKFPDGRIRLYCKGADTVIYERLSRNSKHRETSQTALDVSAHGFILIDSSVFLCCFCGRKPGLCFVFEGVCQRDLADAVLVLQRHQQRGVWHLVQETWRSPGGYRRPRRRPWQSIWANWERPDGEWKQKQEILHWGSWWVGKKNMLLTFQQWANWKSWKTVV